MAPPSSESSHNVSPGSLPTNLHHGVDRSGSSLRLTSTAAGLPRLARQQILRFGGRSARLRFLQGVSRLPSQHLRASPPQLKPARLPDRYVGACSLRRLSAFSAVATPGSPLPNIGRRRVRYCSNHPISKQPRPCARGGCLRCAVCGGNTAANEVASRTVRLEPAIDWREVLPRRSRPPKWLVAQLRAAAANDSSYRHFP